MIKLKNPEFIFGAFYCSLKNALLKRKSTFTAYISKLTLSVSLYMLKKNYFSNVEIININDSARVLYITLNMSDDYCAISSIYLMASKSKSKVINLTYSEVLYIFKSERSIYILSTDKGIMNSLDAIKYKIGGIPLLEIY